MQQQHPPQQAPAQGRQSGRRRHNRKSNHTSARKTYASENDMHSDSQTPIDFSAINPSIPHGTMTDVPIQPSLPTAPKSTKRNGRQPRPNNVSVSPGPPVPGRRTPPQTAGPKFPSSAAFAGATFHASPAPSSLPLPSFLARNFPDSPSNPRDPNNKGVPSPPASDSEAPTPATQSTANAVPREESPLDLFFRADRAEKERARRASSANTLNSAPGPFSPPLEGRSPQHSATSPRGYADHHVRRPGFERLSSSGGISNSELNGTPGQPMGPAFSTPYQDRIRAARLADSQNQQSTQLPRRQPHVDRSDDLKRYLFFGGKQQPPAAPAAPASPVSTAGYASDMSVASSQPSAASIPQIQQAYAASSAASNQAGRPVNLTAMEDSLRQLLKLDLRGSGNPPPPGQF